MLKHKALHIVEFFIKCYFQSEIWNYYSDHESWLRILDEITQPRIFWNFKTNLESLQGNKFSVMIFAINDLDAPWLCAQDIVVSLFNPLSPDMKMHILITDPHTFLVKLVRRICLKINKKSYHQWSLSLFLSLNWTFKQVVIM